MKKTVIIIVGAIVVAALLSAGSFYGGMAYQRNQADQIRNNFLRSRGINPNGGNNGGGTRQGFFGGGATGQVKSVQGNVLTLTTAQQNTTTVNLTNTTQIEKAAPAAATDLQPGVRVLVTGQRDASGNITASTVLILGSNPPSAQTAP